MSPFLICMKAELENSVWHGQGEKEKVCGVSSVFSANKLIPGKGTSSVFLLFAGNPLRWLLSTALWERQRWAS